MHFRNMILTLFMALMAMVLSPCTAFPQNIPKSLIPVPTNRHSQGHVLPPLPPYHASPMPPTAPTSPVWYTPPPVHTSQLLPPPIHNYPGFPQPHWIHPIPRHRLSPPPPSVSETTPPPTPNPTDPTPTPPNSVYLYTTAPAQPPIVVPHSRYPQFPKRRQFPPHRQFPPRHGWMPTPPSN